MVEEVVYEKEINNEMVWNIGKMIMEKQDGNKRAKYGDLLIEGISIKLTENFGKGFSKRNLERMRKIYMCFPIASTLSSQLSISHYYELMKKKDLKKGKVTHQDIGQISTNKNETIVKYTLPEDNNSIFSSESSEKDFINIMG